MRFVLLEPHCVCLPVGNCSYSLRIFSVVFHIFIQLLFLFTSQAVMLFAECLVPHVEHFTATHIPKCWLFLWHTEFLLSFFFRESLKKKWQRWTVPVFVFPNILLSNHKANVKLTRRQTRSYTLTFGRSKKRRSHRLDVDGNALSIALQLKFNEPSPFCSSRAVTVQTLCTSASSFPSPATPLPPPHPPSPPLAYYFETNRMKIYIRASLKSPDSYWSAAMVLGFHLQWDKMSWEYQCEIKFTQRGKILDVPLLGLP